MTRYNTGNPVGSADPRDRDDNSKNLDELVNSATSTSHPDRLGVPRKTWHGMEQDFQKFLLSSGYIGTGVDGAVEDYAAGIEITAMNQIVRAAGELWRISASTSLPYTTTGAGMPEGGAFVSVGDASLRQELAAPGGVLQVQGAVVHVDTPSDLPALADAARVYIVRSDGSRWWYDGAEFHRIPYDIPTALDYSEPSDIPSGGMVFFPDGEYEIPVGVDTSRYYGPGIIVQGGNRLAIERAHVEWSKSAHALAHDLNFGYPDGIIFPEAWRAPQGLAYSEHGAPSLYLMQGVGSASFTDTEAHRIVQYPYIGDGSTASPADVSGELHIGHQGLSSLVLDGVLYLYSGLPSSPGNSGEVNAGKGFSRIEWRGNLTNNSDVTYYRLFGEQGSGHVFEEFYGATSAVSTCGNYVAMVCRKSGSSVSYWLFVYDRLAVEGAADPLDVMPLHMNQLPPIMQDRVFYSQGVACDGKYVYTYNGYINPLFPQRVRKLDLSGRPVSSIAVDSVRGYYGAENLYSGHTTLGCPRAMEPEGMSICGDALLLLTTDNWREYGDIVEYQGNNFAFVGESGGNDAPDISRNSENWVLTNRPATAGSWSSSGSYTRGAETRYGKMVTILKRETDAAGEYPTSSGLVISDSPALVPVGNSELDMSYPYGETFHLSSYGTQTGKAYNQISISAFRQYRFYDSSPSADNSKFSLFSTDFRDGAERLEIRARNNFANGAGINLYGNSELNGRIRFYTGGSMSLELMAHETRQLRPGTDNSQQLGSPSFRWSEVFAGTGTINTSDEREKQQQRALSPAELAVGKGLLGLVSAYKWNAAVDRKGAGARWHFGVMAQAVVELFAHHGLNAFEYGAVCYDEWLEDPEILAEDGTVIQPHVPDGDRYGVRPEELMWLAMAAMASEL
jgi:hypothetical protein